MNVTEASELAADVLEEVSNAVIVDESVLRTVLTGVVSRGHVLLEDVPGTGKTLTARSFSTALGLSFSRIQFTPDLLPSDVTGTYVFNERTREFEFNDGPLSANVVLADEINRASPKTQAALLEAMEERQVTIDGTTHGLPDPFFVIATQNPIEGSEGTFPLPEAQKDRFLVKSSLGYPDAAGERRLLDRREARDRPTPTAARVLDRDEMRAIQQVPERVRVHDDLKEYVVELVRATRTEPRVDVGVSPRGCQRLFEVARTRAALAGREYVTPDDIKAVAEPALSHRLVLTADATIDRVDERAVVRSVVESVPVPSVGRRGTSATSEI
ncbi:AAA family ATPase [Halobellus sp. GM3]|uniref:AAA family ATPase n=1 Tax=Halobellus sp. GM3 TaxID=3458410 RepID=UPI00403DEE2D